MKNDPFEKWCARNMESRLFLTCEHHMMNCNLFLVHKLLTICEGVVSIISQFYKLETLRKLRRRRREWLRIAYSKHILCLNVYERTVLTVLTVNTVVTPLLRNCNVSTLCQSHLHSVWSYEEGDVMKVGRTFLPLCKLSNNTLLK